MSREGEQVDVPKLKDQANLSHLGQRNEMKQSSKNVVSNSDNICR